MKTGKVIMWSAIALVVIGGVYFWMKGKKNVGSSDKIVADKTSALDVIAKYTGKTADYFAGNEDAYLIARANAIISNSPNFIFRNKNYDTQTGKLK